MSQLGFTEIPGSSVVLQSEGVYRVSHLFHFQKQIFAAWGSGFIKLYRHEDGTSKTKVHWMKDSLDLCYRSGEPSFDSLGRMIY